MPFEIVIRSRENEPLFSLGMAARLARVDTQFLVSCEHHGMVKPRLIGDRIRQYTLSDIRQIALIHRLHKELDLDLPALEVVLNLRRQVIKLQEQIALLERQSRLREQTLQAEIHRLRRMLSRMINFYTT